MPPFRPSPLLSLHAHAACVCLVNMTNMPTVAIYSLVSVCRFS
nr:MAG TPA: hypothetical protein [Caudoviricetes sp.]